MVENVKKFFEYNVLVPINNSIMFVFLQFTIYFTFLISTKMSPPPSPLCHTKESILLRSLCLVSQNHYPPLPTFMTSLMNGPLDITPLA